MLAANLKSIGDGTKLVSAQSDLIVEHATVVHGKSGDIVSIARKLCAISSCCPLSQLAELMQGFDRKVTGVLQTVSSASAELEATASSMAATAEETSQQTSTVSSASELASTNVQTVAAAAEPAASIGEIGRQVTQSTRIAGKAVQEANRTNRTGKGLAEAAQQTGTAASEVLSSAGELSKQSAHLRAEVDRFLADVRAACTRTDRYSGPQRDALVARAALGSRQPDGREHGAATQPGRSRLAGGGCKAGG